MGCLALIRLSIYRKNARLLPVIVVYILRIGVHFELLFVESVRVWHALFDFLDDGREGVRMQTLLTKGPKYAELFFELFALISQLGPDKMHDAILNDFELFAKLLNDLLALFIGVLALLLGHIEKLLRPVAERIFLFHGAGLAAAQGHEVADEGLDDVVEPVILPHHLQFLHNEI
jgi:hypothetical protein